MLKLDDKIGELAGKVWRFLEDEGESSVSGIVEAVDAPRSKIHMAIGWLACEGKLEFNTEGRGSTVTLS